MALVLRVMGEDSWLTLTWGLLHGGCIIKQIFKWCLDIVMLDRNFVIGLKWSVSPFVPCRKTALRNKGIMLCENIWANAVQ